MSKLAVFTSMFALIVMAGVCPRWSMGQSQWQRSTLNENKMSIQVGAKVFNRPGDDSSLPIVTDTITNTTLLSSDQATDFGSAFGLEIILNGPGHYDRNLEFRTVLTNWDEEQSITGVSLASPFFPDPLNPPQTFNYDIESDFYSFELIRKRSVRPGLTLGFGPRFVSTSDEIAVESILTDAATAVTASQFNDFEAENSIIGLQANIEYNQPISQAVSFTFIGRAGGYFNSTEVNTSVLNTADAVVTTTRRQASTESFIAELGGRVNFEIIPNGLSTYLGYEATVIDGIALAAPNVIDTSPIDTNNTVFFDAITFGVNLSF